MSQNELRSKILARYHYDPRDEASIRERAEKLVGRTVKSILPAKHPLVLKRTRFIDKGQIGNLIQEHWFGLPRNPYATPDFEEPGIELKIVPLELREKGLTVKERTKVCNINYHELVKEEWPTSHAKKKLEKVLFIYFEYYQKDNLRSKVINTDLWELRNIPERAVIEGDWRRVKRQVNQGLAHELSETMSDILAACRTGQGGKDKEGRPRDEVTQPKAPHIRALKRAFALKQSYTNQRWEEISGRKRYVSIVGQLQGATYENFIPLLLKELGKYEGMTLGGFARRFNIPVPNGKNAAATIIKKAIGFNNVNSRVAIKELVQLGIEVRIIPLSMKNGVPFEAVSFPAFKMKELVCEDWEDAVLPQYLDKILFIPHYREQRKTDIKEAIIGRAFLWQPHQEEWKVIKREWENYRAEIKRGKARPTKVRRGRKYFEETGLTKESGTKMIHIRPHGRDRNDRDVDPFGYSVVKQSFWLNKRFVHEIVRSNLGSRHAESN